MQLLDYHLAWLVNHPERDEAWLDAMLKDGFEIHHIDSDHDNNDPSNLALIEGMDHARLHGWGRRLGISIIEGRKRAAADRMAKISAKKRSAIARKGGLAVQKKWRQKQREQRKLERQQRQAERATG